MTASYLHIEWHQLALSATFLLAAGALSLRYRLGLHKDLLIGGVRCCVQLLVMGYVLQWIFNTQSALLVMGLLVLMGFFATRIAGDRVKEKSISFFWPTFWAIQITFFGVGIIVSACIVQATPWCG